MKKNLLVWMSCMSCWEAKISNMEILLKTIRTFADKETYEIFCRKRVRKWDGITKKALKVLVILNAVNNLRELQFSFDARLHKLHGNREGQYSIRINPQYRICFYWKDNQAYKVEITDYH